MLLPDRTGTFKVGFLEWGVAKSTNGFPQFNARFALKEYYDEQEKEWFDVSEFGWEMPAYFTLFGNTKGKLKPSLNHTQVSKVTGWDGKSFATLANGDYSALDCQIRIEDNDYPGANCLLQVNWIDAVDADPNRQLRKLDTVELKGLDAEYAALLQGSSKPQQAVSAKPQTVKSKPVAKKPPVVQTTTETEEQPKPPTPEEKKAELLRKSQRIRDAAKPKPKAAPPTRKPAGTVTVDLPQGKATKQEVWETVCELKADEVTDKQLNDSWQKAIIEVAGADTTDENITPEQWFRVREQVLDEVGKF